MPIYRRLPWRGFRNPTQGRYQVVNLGRLQKAIDGGKLDPAKPINEAVLCEAGIVTHLRDAGEERDRQPREKFLYLGAYIGARREAHRH